MNTIRHLGNLFFLCGVVVVLVGCTTYQKQLEKVAKDWSMVVRASQVIPVYPLVEDIEPGDVFLVQTPIAAQHEIYNKKGFLPLDQHMTRLAPMDYSVFYRSAYGINGHENTPDHWREPEGMPTTAEKSMSPVEAVDEAEADVEAEDGDIDEADEEEEEEEEEETPLPKRHLAQTNWYQAPRAAFPSYTFKVESGQGINVALPVKGVPVALSLLNTDQATGSVTIADAYTFGLPYDQMEEKVYLWASHPANRRLLRDMAGQAKQRTMFLRVVSRVYMTGKVIISMTATGAGSAGLDAGLP